MPWAPKHPCTWPGCKELVKDGSRCEAHKRQAMHEYNVKRGGSTKQGYGHHWQVSSEAFRRDAIWCAECLKDGVRTPATEVDHIQPHRGDPELMWDTKNWQALCKRCHSRKTAKHDKRWG